MKKVAIVALSVALEGEKGYTRFRTLAEMLSEHYEVDLITSSFQHWEKRQRDICNFENKYKYRVLFAKEPGYKKNVDVRRIISVLFSDNNAIKLLKSNSYDLIYCVVPSNRVAARAAKLAKKNNIGLILDIEDLWPEAMEMVFPLPSLLNKIVYAPYRYYAKVAYKLADGFIGTSDEYRDIPITKYGVSCDNRKTVYVGCDLEDYDSGVTLFVDDIKKSESEFWVTYAGNLGSSYDIPTLIRAAQALYGEGFGDIKFKILGGGPLEQEFKRIASENPCNVEFLGYVEYNKMAAYLSKSDVLVNSFVKSAPQSIVTKIGDYLAAAKPMINTLSSSEFRKKVEEDGFGINVEAENPEELSNAIKKLKENGALCDEMGMNARKIAEEQFDRKTSYKTIIEMISKVLA